MNSLMRIVSIWLAYLLAVLCGAFSVDAAVAVGDTFEVWAGYGNSIGMSGGSTKAVEIVVSESRSGDTTVFRLRVVHTETSGFFEFGGQMSPLIEDNDTFFLKILSVKPSEVVGNSNLFEGRRWILAGSFFLLYPDLAPLGPFAHMPILDTGLSVSQNDYYTVRATDTSGMIWKQHPEGERWFAGYPVKYANSSDLTGDTLTDSLEDWGACRKEPFWIPTNAGWDAVNPIEIFRIETSSECSALEGRNLTMGGGCYSSQITYYRKVGPTSVAKRSGVKANQVCSRLDRFDLRGRLLPPSPVHYAEGVVIVARQGRITTKMASNKMPQDESGSPR